MNLADLNQRVTTAILRAEGMPAGPAAMEAFHEVADLEEEIATLCGVTTVQGAAARLGAIAASLSAHEPLRALQLADRYGETELSNPARAELQSLVDEANAMVEAGAAVEPTIGDATFTMRLVA